MSFSGFEDIPEEDTVEERLRKIQKAVDKASQKIDPNHPNASLHLGMELFGQDPQIVERELQGRLKELEDDLDQLMENEGENLDREALQSQVTYLKACSQARQSLDAALSNDEDLPQAARSLAEAIKYCQSAKATPVSGKLVPILQELSKECRLEKVKLMSKVATLWASNVTLQPRSLSVRGEMQWDVSQNLDDNRQNLDLLARFTTSIQRSLFDGLLSKEQPWILTETEDRSTPLADKIVTKTKARTKTLEWRDKNEDMEHEPKPLTPVERWTEIFAIIQKVLVFVAENVAQSRPDLCGFVGRRFFGKPDAPPPELNLAYLGIESRRLENENGLLLDPLIDALTKTFLPEYLPADEVGMLQELSDELRGIIEPFLETLVVHKIIGDDRYRLVDFVGNLEKAYIDRRHATVLEAARKLLVENDYHNTVEVGTDATDEDGQNIFLLHRSNVSDTAHKLLDLARTTMDEAVSYGTLPDALADLPRTLYLASRECFDLYRAIIPTTFQREIQTLPRTAAVFHNDGVFLAHHCLTLGLEYRDRYAKEQEGHIRKTCIFVDMVPVFRQLADRAMHDMILLQSNEISQLIEERISYLGKSLRSNDVVAEWSDAESAIEAGLYHIRHLRQTWKPVLSVDVLNQSLCYLADVLFHRFLEQLKEATDISTSAGQFLQSLFDQAISGIEELVAGNTKLSRYFDRFVAVSKFTGMSLSDIELALSDGVFRSVSGNELSHLIKACFDDSPKRRNLLSLLASHS